ncbi:hypothetical protein ADK56_04705 [Streptomyces sp. MMG1522]|nr:hypothetical protein ADK88_33480 [Streptomyces sp. NRRL F-2295]KOU54058.1 hypothetical protein ADK56_04705 [Streptomyces sp. MMG1522]
MFHHSLSRAVRDQNVRKVQRTSPLLPLPLAAPAPVPVPVVSLERTRRRWPATERLFSEVLMACWPYRGRCLASCFTLIAAPWGRRSMKPAT